MQAAFCTAGRSTVDLSTCQIPELLFFITQSLSTTGIKNANGDNLKISTSDALEYNKRDKKNLTPISLNSPLYFGPKLHTRQNK